MSDPKVYSKADPRVYAKSIIAFLGALSAWGTSTFDDGKITGPEWFGLCLVLVAALTVYVYPNKDA